MTPAAAPGWYPAQGDPAGTVRYWDGTAWIGGPAALPTRARYIEATAGRLELAGPWLRVGALLIDIIALFLISAVLTVPLLIFLSPVQDWAVQFVVQATYGVLPVALWGRTVGKLIVGVRIVNADGVSSPGLVAAIVRGVLQPGLPFPALLMPVALVVLINLSSVAAVLISFVLLFADAERRTLWDRLARTRVVRA